MGRLENKVIIVTGAAGGIGEAYSQKFVEEGANMGVFLLSDESTYSTGAEFVVDGGLLLK